MNDLRTLLRDQLRLVVGLAFVGCLVPLQVAAQVSSPAFERFRSQVVGNNVNFTFGGNGTPLAGAGNATGIGVASGVDVARGTTVNTKHGPINGTLRQKVSSGAMAKSVGRLAGAGSFATPLGLAFLAAPFVIDWFASAGMSLPGGVPSILEVQHPTYTDAYEYQYSSSGWSLSIMPACNAWVAAFSGGQFTWGAPTYVAPQSCRADRTTTSTGFTTPITQAMSRRDRTSNPIPPQQLPASAAEIESRLSVVTNPTPEAMAELYKLGDNGPLSLAHPIPDLVDTLRAEFEARSPETTDSKTTDSPSETKTEEKKCATYTEIIGSTLYLREDCATTTTTQPKDPETGEPVGAPKVETSTSTSNAPDPATKEDKPAEDPCLTSPNRAACVELGTAEGEIPKATRSVAYAPEFLFGNGTCPADKTITAYGTTFQITDMALTCDMLSTYAKPIVILLAAFSALMIVAVGMPE